MNTWNWRHQLMLFLAQAKVNASDRPRIYRPIYHAPSTISHCIFPLLLETLQHNQFPGAHPSLYQYLWFKILRRLSRRDPSRYTWAHLDCMTTMSIRLNKGYRWSTLPLEAWQQTESKSTQKLLELLQTTQCIGQLQHLLTLVVTLKFYFLKNTTLH